MPVLVPTPNAGVILTRRSVTWRGLTFDTRGLYRLETLEGWAGKSPARVDDLPRSRGHGSYASPAQGGPRTVMANGWCVTESVRDELLWQLENSATPTDDPSQTEDLTVEMAGRQLTARAQLIAWAPTLQHWASGGFGWAVQWRCPDPRRYGLEQSASTTLQQPGGGITPPFTPPLVLPERPAGGFVSVSNDGNAPTPPVIVFTGPQSRPGVVNRTRGLFQSYALDLGDTDTLMVDVASGRAMLNGNAYRAPAPGSAVTAEFELAPGVNDLEVLGSATGVGSPGMSVSWKPAWW